MFIRAICILAGVSFAMTQRAPFAGKRPIGYPELYDRTTTESLGNRFGEGDATTEKLPLEALGDRELVERLSKLPVDQQPFWLLNWKALEEHRKNPQTFQQKPNVFIDPPNFTNVPNRSGPANLPTNSVPNNGGNLPELDNRNGGTEQNKPIGNNFKPEVINANKVNEHSDLGATSGFGSNHKQNSDKVVHQVNDSGVKNNSSSY